MIPISAPSLTALERDYLLEAFDSGWISGMGGSFIPRFEAALAQQVQRKHCIAVSNGTVALALALQALGIGPGDEVIVPALTFVSPAAMVRAVGAMPVFADVYANTWNISARHVAQLITPRTKAIIAVDVMGHPCNYLDLAVVAHGIPIIEDAAQAHGALYHGIPCGKFGVISTFSFFSNKGVTCGEGGAVLTDDPDLATQMRVIANHGQTPGRPYWHDVVGSNYRTTNLHAAIGLAQVERWEELTCARQWVARWYDERLADLFDDTELWRRPVADGGDAFTRNATESCWLYPLHHPDRDRIVQHLRENGIDARAIWTPLCDLPLYRESCRGEYPNARHVGVGAFFLPTSAIMTEVDVQFVAEKVREAVRADNSRSEQ